ncbi:MAG: purine-nucleoside phosphorylase [Longimicrobiales bacterium]
MLVLGSGLGRLGDDVAEGVVVGFEEIPGFAAPTVAGHRGRLVAGDLEGVPCLICQGRFHLYEGHDPALAALPVRVGAALGVEVLIVTNAAGGIDRSFEPGDLMLIEDQLGLFTRSSLIGPAGEREARFPDMSEPYSRELQALAEQVALREGVRLRRGVYAALPGPSYETPAEIRMLDRLGADAVGMSTVPEVLAARALGMSVLGISLISNSAAGISTQPLSHEDVLRAGEAARETFTRLVRALLRELPTLPRRSG